MGDAAELCTDMFKSIADPCADRLVIANFSRRASDSFPDRRRGVNFEYKYFDISAGGNSAFELVCERGPKGPMRNCYTSVPKMIEFRPLTQRCDVRSFFSGRRPQTRIQLWEFFFHKWRS